MGKIRVLVRASERPFKLVAYKQSYKNLRARTVSLFTFQVPLHARVFSVSLLWKVMFLQSSHRHLYFVEVLVVLSYVKDRTQ